MLRTCSLLGCIGLVAVAGGCAKPSTDGRDAGVAAVRQTETDWVKDIATKDVEKFASYYASNASVLFPNMPVINGKDEIRATLKSMLADPNFSLTFQASRVESSDAGDVVYSQGAYTMTMSDPKDKTKTMTDKGKYLTIFRKQPDGTWKAVADMINSDLPNPL